MSNKPPLLEQVRRCLRLKHYSIRTERAYVDWVKRFILFHGKRHPGEMGTDEIRHFLSHLATTAQVAAATQNQALCSLLFLYREVLGVELPYGLRCKDCLEAKMAVNSFRAYAATPNRLATNFACPAVSVPSNLLTCPLPIM